ncbi:MAG: hypothetical protein ACRC5T_14050 [Cetobacterium sp.]
MIIYKALYGVENDFVENIYGCDVSLDLKELEKKQKEFLGDVEEDNRFFRIEIVKQNSKMVEYKNKYNETISDFKEIKANYIKILKEWTEELEIEDKHHINSSVLKVIEEETLKLLRYLRTVKM